MNIKIKTTTKKRKTTCAKSFRANKTLTEYIVRYQGIGIELYLDRQDGKKLTIGPEFKGLIFDECSGLTYAAVGRKCVDHPDEYCAIEVFDVDWDTLK